MAIGWGKGEMGREGVIAVVVAMAIVGAGARPDKETMARFWGDLARAPPPSGSGDGGVADFLERVLEKEFGDQESKKGSDGSNFNSSVTDHQAVLETVAIITHEKNTSSAKNGSKHFQIKDVFSLDNEDPEDGTTLIDKEDNVFVMSNRKSKYPVLQVDLRFISDLVLVIVSATTGGIVFSCIGQPVIVGYLLAGSLIGPGGLKFINEIVQVETVAQFGVIFLIFALGLEFSLPKLKAVFGVAVVGGILQIGIFMFLCGVTAMLCGAKLSEGIFVGALLSMSSTAIVSKFLAERGNNLIGSYSQVTIGTLILQDFVVGLLFALLPILGGHGGFVWGVFSMAKMVMSLSLFLVAASILSWGFVPRFFKLMTRLSSHTNELYQLASVAFCLLFAWCSDKLGLSLELGAFVAGFVISTTDSAQHTLDQIEAIRNLFAALFLASIGMLIHVRFLWAHVDILLASVILVILVKTVIIAVVVKAFGYSIRTSFLVALSLSQIGELAFVLLSRASNLHIIEGKIYLLLLGTTALSLVTTPLILKLIPAVLHLGGLMRWFPSLGSSQAEEKSYDV
ncbi:K(+) efflux antiporter 5-like [Wolffia australiana]